MRRLRTYLVASIVIVIGAVAATVLSGNAPVLGLDLQGGISVTYAPVGKFKSSSLDETLNIINNRVNTFGVAEPDISRQGNDIIVELPGVKDRAKALRLVGRTAQLRFRPVLANVPADPSRAAGQRAVPRRRGPVAVLIPVGHGMAAVATFALAVVTAAGMR